MISISEACVGCERSIYTLAGLYLKNLDMICCSSTGYVQLLSSSLIVCLIPMVSLCGGWSRLISIYSLVQVPAGLLNCWALFRDCVAASRMYKLFKLGMLFPCKRLLQIWSIRWQVFGKALCWWTPTRTTTNNWPLIIILGLPSLILGMSVCWQLYQGIVRLICPNMLCTMSVAGQRFWAY